MDLSVYIAEYLAEHGTVSIPKIGVFKQVRMRGYYNAEEGKLYPPHFEVNFEQQFDTDDSLLKYIIGKANVSEQSARYFIDKYLQNVLQQAEIGEALLSGLGWLSAEGDKLTFRPAPNLTAATAAFGFSPVAVKADQEPAQAVQQTPPLPATPAQPTANTIAQIPVVTAPVVVIAPVETAQQPIAAEHAAQPAAAPAQPQQQAPLSPLLRPQPAANAPTASSSTAAQPAAPVQAAEPQHNDYTPKPFYKKTWFYAALAGIVIIAGVIFFYPRPGIVNAATTVIKDTTAPSTDSVVLKTPVVQDTTAARAVPRVTDSAAASHSLPASTEYAPEIETPGKGKLGKEISNTEKYRFVLIGGSYGTQDQAQAAAERYHAAGINASAFENTGRTIKVALGYYPTYADGQNAKKELVKQQKVLSWKLYVETIRKPLNK